MKLLTPSSERLRGSLVAVGGLPKRLDLGVGVGRTVRGIIGSACHGRGGYASETTSGWRGSADEALDPAPDPNATDGAVSYSSGTKLAQIVYLGTFCALA